MIPPFAIGRLAAFLATACAWLLLPALNLPATPPPVIELNASALAIRPSDGPLTVRVARRGDLSGISSVSFATSNETAVAGVHYTAASGVLTFAAGEGQKTFTVSALGGMAVLTLRTFRVHLFNPSGATLGDLSQATVTRVDDNYAAVLDPWFNPGRGADQDIFALALTPEGRIVVGGQFGAFDQRFSLHGVARLLPDGAVDPAFTLPDEAFYGAVYAVALQPDGRLLIGGDFTWPEGNARPYLARLRNDGSLDPDFTPPNFNDGLRAIVVQPDGDILIAGRFTQADGQARGRVARLKPDGSLDPAFATGAGANNHIRAMARQPDGRVLVSGQFTTFDGVSRRRVARLTDGGVLDLAFNPGTGADAQVRSVAVQENGRILIGGEFTAFNGVTRPGAARLFGNGVLDLAFDAGPVEGGFVRVVAPAPGGKVWIGGTFSAAGGLSRVRLARLDSAGRADGLDTGNPGGEVFAIVTQPDGQTLVAGDFESIGGASLRRIARLNTGNSPPRFECAPAGTNVSESAGAQAVTVLRRGDYTTPAEVGYTTRDGTARAGTDYTSAGGTLRFEAGETARRVIIPLLNDSVPEPPETFFVMLENPAAPAILGRTTNSVITIQDDDRGFEFAVEVFGGSEPGGQATITVWRGGTGDDTVSVDYVIAPGTAQAGVDYFASNGTLVFEAGQTQKTFTVSIVADELEEGRETVLLALANPRAGTYLGVRSAAMLNVEDVDSTFEWGWVSVGAEPGRGEMFAVVERRGVMSLPATVEYETVDGTAMAGADYLAAAGTLTFASGQAYATFIPGQTYRLFHMTILNDGLVEGDETFHLRLSNPTGGAALGARSNAAVTIRDNDGGLGFAETNVVVSENSPVVTLTLRRYDDGDEPLSVEYFTSEGTALAGRNFLPVEGVATLAAFEDPITVTVPLLDECVLTGERVFTVRLRNPSPGGAFVTNHVTTVIVQGNDRPGRRDLSFRRDPPPNQAIGEVAAVALLPEGGLLGGARWGSHYHNSQWLPPLFRLHPDGSVDEAFQGDIPAWSSPGVTALAVQRDGRILVAGWTYQGEGLAYFWLFRLHQDGQRDESFQAPPNLHVGGGVGNIVIHHLGLQPDGRILVAKDFQYILGPTDAGVLRLLPDGALDPAFDAGSGAEFLGYRSGVQTLALQPDGRILVGGLFTNFSGVARAGLARLLPNGALDLSFDPGGGPTNQSGPDVKRIQLQRDGRILVLGGFTHVSGVAQAGVARLLPDGALDTTFDPGVISGGVRAMVLQANGKVVIGGTFTNVQGHYRHGLARLRPDGSVDTSFDPWPAQHDTVALALQPDGRILVSSARFGLLRVDGDPIPRFLGLTREPGGVVRLRVDSRPGQTYGLEGSTNLRDWLPLQTKTAPDCSLEFLDPAGPDPQRFYRVTQVAPP